MQNAHSVIIPSLSEKINPNVLKKFLAMYSNFEIHIHFVSPYPTDYYPKMQKYLQENHPDSVLEKPKEVFFSML